MECAVSLVPTPATTTARSPTASSTASSTARCSASVMVGDSPVVPATTRPSCAHRSTRWAASSCAPARSIVPSSARGVTIAVSTRPKGRAASVLMGRIYRPLPGVTLTRSSPGDGFPRLREPDVEEVRQIRQPREAPLGERDEVLHARIAVLVCRVPVAQQRQEGVVVPDLLPQGLQRHGTALVHRRAKTSAGPPGSPGGGFQKPVSFALVA